MRLIDADALHDELKAKQKWVVRRGEKYNEGYTYDQVHFAIDDAPTVEAEPVRHGHWIIKGDWCTCSVCKQSMHYERSESGKSSIINALSMAVHYCAGCGAKMDERKEE